MRKFSMKMKIHWITPTSIFLIALAMGHAQYAIAGNSEAIKEAKRDRDKIVELQREQASTNGKLLEGLEVLKEQNRLIQQRLWNMQNSRPPVSPSR